MQPLRIAQVMASGPVQGGLEKHFVELCNGLSEQHEVLALSHPAHGSGLSKQVNFQPLDLSLSRRNPLNFFRLHRALSRPHHRSNNYLFLPVDRPRVAA